MAPYVWDLTLGPEQDTLCPALPLVCQDSLPAQNQTVVEGVAADAPHNPRYVCQDGVAADSLALEGKPAETIIQAARDNDCDLIVLGSHGRTGLDRLLMGSVSQQVVTHAKCPVLVVKGG